MKIENSDIYEQIGNLFYAVATDQLITPLELAELKSLISKDWLPGNPEAKISDETHWMLVAIDGLEGEGTSSDQAYEQFRRFFLQHPEIFNKEVRDRILATCKEITEVFNHGKTTSKSKLISLAKLLDIDEVPVAK